jgi:hypothetical protein
MKKFISTLCLISALAVAPAFGADRIVRATVPFEFVVGDATLPAGEYDFKNGINAESILVSNTNGKNAAFVVTNCNAPILDGPISLAFRTVNGKRYLETVSTGELKRDIRVSAKPQATMAAQVR